jgi:hypothetical protein
MMLVMDPPLVYVVKEGSESSRVVRTNVMVCIQSRNPCPFHSGIVSYDLNKTVTKVRQRRPMLYGVQDAPKENRCSA